jgi:hypothetical protein
MVLVERGKATKDWRLGVMEDNSGAENAKSNVYDNDEDECDEDRRDKTPHTARRNLTIPGQRSVNNRPIHADGVPCVVEGGGSGLSVR